MAEMLIGVWQAAALGSVTDEPIVQIVQCGARTPTTLSLAIDD
jgi:hypothetical protein